GVGGNPSVHALGRRAAVGTAPSEVAGATRRADEDAALGGGVGDRLTGGAARGLVAADAHLAVADVGARARVAVRAGGAVGGMQAAQVRIADVVRARVAVVAAHR